MMLPDEYQLIFNHFTTDGTLYDISKLYEMKKMNPIPPTKGIYGFYFDDHVTSQTIGYTVRIHDSHTLLYIGVAGKDSASKQTLKKRIGQHRSGNINGSTLRKTLAPFVNKEKILCFQKTDSKKLKLTENSRRKLTNWISKHSRIRWYETAQPWRYETRLIQNLDTPLNLECNGGHPFYDTLQSMRAAFLSQRYREYECV